MAFTWRDWQNPEDLGNYSQPASTDLDTGRPDYETGMLDIQLQ
jgi:hypothetical protein